MNNPNYTSEYDFCLKTATTSSASVDCVECNLHAQKESSSWVEALGVIAQPLAALASTYLTAKYQYKTQQAWADAYSSGYSQCTNRFNSYLNYTTTNGANPVSASEAQSFADTCNNNSLMSYAGYTGLSNNGYAGFSNPFQSAGYSSGFLSGMAGPYYGGNSFATNYFGSGLGMNLGGNLAGMMGYGSTMFNGMNSTMFNQMGYGLGSSGIGSGNSYNIYGSNNYSMGNITGLFNLTGGISSAFSF
jgi:hypothetical protein